MKKIIGVLLIIMALFGLTACGNNNGNTGNNGGNNNQPSSSASNILIAYFSCTYTTEAIAIHIESKTKGALYEIVPEAPYTADDLKYYTGGRADKEQADPNARPAISGNVNNMDKYDVIF